MLKLLLFSLLAVCSFGADVENFPNVETFEELQKMIRDIVSENIITGVRSLRRQGRGQIVEIKPSEQRPQISEPIKKTLSETAYLPVIQMHGMGDFAKDPLGMVPLAKAISEYLDGTYVLNVQIGPNFVADILNGFLMNLDDQVDYFAGVVKADENLVNGFNAIGYSQGNLIIRGYIERYNDPPVRNFISMHGPMSGVAGLPGCSVDHEFCLKLDELIGKFVYVPFVQKHLAQANYYRDPENIDKYLANDKFLADINNERDSKDSSYSTHWSSLNSLCLVKALGDTVVIPNDSEWFQFYEDGGYDSIWQFDNTPWYVGDSFGLKTLNEKGNIYFNTTDGDHLDFSQDFLLTLVGLYFK